MCTCFECLPPSVNSHSVRSWKPPTSAEMLQKLTNSSSLLPPDIIQNRGARVPASISSDLKLPTYISWPGSRGNTLAENGKGWSGDIVRAGTMHHPPFHEIVLLHIATIISKFLENYKTCQAMPCHATPHPPPPLLVPPEGSGTKALWPECAQALKSKDPLGPQLSLAVGIFPVQQPVPVGHGQTLSRLINEWRRVIRTFQEKTQRSTLDFSILICLLIFIWKGKKQEGVLWAQKHKMLVTIFGCLKLVSGLQCLQFEFLSASIGLSQELPAL